MNLVKGRTGCALVYLREMRKHCKSGFPRHFPFCLHGQKENHKHFKLQNVPCLCGVGKQIIVVDVCTKDLEWGQPLYFNRSPVLLLATFKSLPSPGIKSRNIQKADSFCPEGAES